MSFRYLFHTPDGQTHTTTGGAEEFEALLDKLQAQFPDDEIEVEADVVDPLAAALLKELDCA